jgi:hypothetical protein
MITKHVAEYIDWLQNTISRFKLDDNPECITCNGTSICGKEIKRAGSIQNPYKERNNSCGGHLSMDISLSGIVFLISQIFNKYTQHNFDGIKAEVIISINMAIP